MRYLALLGFISGLGVAPYAHADTNLVVEEIKKAAKYYLSADQLLPYSDAYVDRMAEELGIQRQLVEDITGLFMLWLVQHGVLFSDSGFPAALFRRLSKLEEHKLAQWQRYLYMGALIFRYFGNMPAFLGTTLLVYRQLFRFVPGGESLAGYVLTGNIGVEELRKN